MLEENCSFAQLAEERFGHIGSPTAVQDLRCHPGVTYVVSMMSFTLAGGPGSWRKSTSCGIIRVSQTLGCKLRGTSPPITQDLDEFEVLVQRQHALNRTSSKIHEGSQNDRRGIRGTVGGTKH